MTMGSKVWDYAPISLLLKEAGCKVTNFENKEWSIADRSMIAANPNLHATLVELFE
jgi:fructose-1,6-bisphosphatase/inositol monophosphatase family enzyme